MKICPKCGAQCQDRMKFCLNCGQPFAMKTQEDAEIEKTLQAAVQKQEVLPDEPAGKESAVDKEPVADKEAKTAEAFREEPVITRNEEPVKESTPAKPEKPADEPKTKRSAETSAVKKTEKIPEPEENEKKHRGFFSLKDSEEDEDDYPDEFEEDEPDEDTSNKTMSVFAVLSLIFSLIGVVSCGFGCVLSFSNLGLAAAFFAPALLGIIFGIVGLMTSGKYTMHRGKPLAIIGTVVGLLAIVLWIVLIFMLRNQISANGGTPDMMSVISMILKN